MKKGEIAHNFIDLSGQRFGMIQVLERDDISRKHFKWICKCDCGTIKSIRGDLLRIGKVKSCGCNKSKYLSIKNMKHGLARHPLYNVWKKMIDRCENSNNQSYKDYGGRGIYICEEWKNDVWSFFLWAVTHHYKYGLSIDRINNNDGYKPDNCKFSTQKEQNNNRRPAIRRKIKTA